MKRKKRIPQAYRIWSEGKYIDLWNIPHFLISMIISFIFVFFNFNLSMALLGIVILKTIWEIYEHIYVTKEAYTNKLCDVLTGVLAVLFTYKILPTNLINIPVVITLIIISVILGSWGLYSMKRLELFIKKK
jgi:hypothetical protein